MGRPAFRRPAAGSGVHQSTNQAEKRCFPMKSVEGHYHQVETRKASCHRRRARARKFRKASEQAVYIRIRNFRGARDRETKMGAVERGIGFRVSQSSRRVRHRVVGGNGRRASGGRVRPARLPGVS